ncbi:MAG: DUF2182 domain-containing protein [Actinomycetota bacterium]
MATLTAQPPTGRQARGVARTIWAIAAACWAVMVVAVLLGGDVHGHHDFVLEESTLAWPWRLAIFAGAWQVMIGAMMLPSTIPLLDLFWAASARQPRPLLARTALVVPYLAVWLGFSGTALAGDAVVHAAVDAWGWLAAREGLVLGTTLVLAGGFQFSELKKACLTACRSPLSMLWEHYDRGVRSAWRLGVRHALLCLGCCWALMLVMFATGTGSLIWMLLLTGVMVAEKTKGWGARIVAPTGIAFIASGLAISAVALAFPQ